MTGSTRSPDRADEIREAGAEAVICDAFDAEGLKRAVMGAMPDVVVNELTSLPRDYDPRKLDESFYAPTNRVRTEGGGNLLEFCSFLHQTMANKREAGVNAIRTSPLRALSPVTSTTVRVHLIWLGDVRSPRSPTNLLVPPWVKHPTPSG